MEDHKDEHKVESKWRETEIADKSERVLAIMAWLDHTLDLIEMLGDDEKLAGDLRGVAGTVRTKRNDISNEVEALRAELADRKNK